jgi:hypothetical protein
MHIQFRYASAWDSERRLVRYAGETPSSRPGAGADLQRQRAEGLHASIAQEMQAFLRFYRPMPAAEKARYLQASNAELRRRHGAEYPLYQLRDQGPGRDPALSYVREGLAIFPPVDPRRMTGAIRPGPVAPPVEPAVRPGPVPPIAERPAPPVIPVIPPEEPAVPPRGVAPPALEPFPPLPGAEPPGPAGGPMGPRERYIETDWQKILSDTIIQLERTYGGGAGLGIKVEMDPSDTTKRTILVRTKDQPALLFRIEPSDDLKSFTVRFGSRISDPRNGRSTESFVASRTGPDLADIIASTQLGFNHEPSMKELQERNRAERQSEFQRLQDTLQEAGLTVIGTPVLGASGRWQDIDFRYVSGGKTRTGKLYADVRISAADGKGFSWKYVEVASTGYTTRPTTDGIALSLDEAKQSMQRSIDREARSEAVFPAVRDEVARLVKDYEIPANLTLEAVSGYPNRIVVRDQGRQIRSYDVDTDEGKPSGLRVAGRPYWSGTIADTLAAQLGILKIDPEAGVKLERARKSEAPFREKLKAVGGDRFTLTGVESRRDHPAADEPVVFSVTENATGKRITVSVYRYGTDFTCWLTSPGDAKGEGRMAVSSGGATFDAAMNRAIEILANVSEPNPALQARMEKRMKDGLAAWTDLNPFRLTETTASRQSVSKSEGATFTLTYGGKTIKPGIIKSGKDSDRCLVVMPDVLINAANFDDAVDKILDELKKIAKDLIV